MGNFKKMVRARMEKTGEAWQSAQRWVREQDRKSRSWTVSSVRECPFRHDGDGAFPDGCNIRYLENEDMPTKSSCVGLGKKGCPLKGCTIEVRKE